MKIEKRPSYPHVGFLYKARRGRISPNRKPDDMVWQRSGGRIYVTCRSCASINDITKFSVWWNGAVSSCIVCHHCYGHFGVTLLGWNGLSSYVCSKCMVSTRSKGFPKGWSEDLTRLFCPNCKP